MAPPYPGCAWSPVTEFLPPGAQANRRKEILEGRLTFLSREEIVGWPPAWQKSDLPKLWQYNIHYFEYVWALGFEDARLAVGDWIRNHQLGPNAVGWEPYPTSLRIQNWCGYFFVRHRGRVEQDPAFLQALWGSLCGQLHWLRSRLEHHLLGNHLFENLSALIIFGTCFRGHETEKWYKSAVVAFVGELREQILADGGHFERSPMYHERVAYVLATLFNVGSQDVREKVGTTLEQVLSAAVRFRLGDGELALANDSAFRVYNPAPLVAAYARASGLNWHAPGSAGAFALPASGYYGWASADGSGVFCDAAAIGPDYLPGHAHGDLFSFELCYRGFRVIVDSGVFDYEAGEMRRYCRSTAAHNTVEVDGEDQCEFWGAFRVARRGQPRGVTWHADETGFRLGGWHDGYRRLRGRPVHRREFVWYAPGILMVRDHVRSRSSHAVVSRLHLHPQAKILARDVLGVTVATPGGVVRILVGGPVAVGVEGGWYCPEFGVKVRNEVLTLRATAANVEFGFCCLLGDVEGTFSLSEGVVTNGNKYAWRTGRGREGD